MPRFAANISMMYGDVPFPDRFEAAARDGFCAVECQFPYDWPAQELAARLRGAGLTMVLMNAPPGGTDQGSIAAAMAAGTRGLASLPGREQELEHGFALALAYAEAFECPRIHLMAGIAPAGADRGAMRKTFVSNVRNAARMAAAAGRDVVIEPINTRDIPGFFLNRQEDAHAAVQESGAANAKVQMDLYHCQIVEGDLAQNIRRYLPTGRVGHFQIAGNPARNEPDEGEVDYGYLCRVIDEVAAQCGWDGWIGAEYKPRRGAEPGGTSAGLGWLKRWSTS